MFLPPDASGAKPFTADFVVVGTLTEVGDGLLEVHEEGTLDADGGATSSTGALVGLSGVSGVFTGATGRMIVAGSGGPTADYQFDFDLATS